MPVRSPIQKRPLAEKSWAEGKACSNTNAPRQMAAYQRAMTFAGFDLNPAVMKGHKAVDESETEPAPGAGRTGFCLEAIEHFWPDFRGNAGTCV